jgi:hypothetical protein
MAEGQKKCELWVLPPTLERQKFGETDDYGLLNQNILFQSTFYFRPASRMPINEPLQAQRAQRKG